MKRVRVLFAPENRGFADILNAALDEGGFEPVADGSRVNAALVLWTPASVRSPAVTGAARRALGNRVLVPVAIGKTPPPPSFEHLWPMDLAGWSGDIVDPRWRFVLEELEIALRRRADIALDAEEPEIAYAAASALAGRPAFAEPRRRVYAAPAPGALVGAAPRRAPSPVPVMRSSEPPLESPAPPPADIVQLDEDDGGDDPILLDDVRAVERFTPAPGAVATPPAHFSRAALIGGVFVAALAAVTVGTYVFGARTTPVDARPQTSAPPIVAYVEPAEAPPPASDDNQTTNEAADDGAATALDIGALAEAAVEERVAAEAAAVGADPIAGRIWESTRDAAAEEAYFGNYFRECLECPDMAVLETGGFMLGSPADEPGRGDDEGPTVDVSITRRFAMSTREITFEQWDACMREGGCAAQPSDSGFGRGKRPVLNVSWSEARAFAAWLSKKTGSNYRLPTEAEWEYAARGGREGPFSFDDAPGADKANYDGARPYAGEAAIARGATLPAGSFAPNAYGLFDVHGNVWEWTADCWSPNHASASTDGAAVGGACEARVIKGGGWNSPGAQLRAAEREPFAQGARRNDVGLRLVRDMP
jgi:formylglycine-generating enzyme required for sulfatase activity